MTLVTRQSMTDDSGLFIDGTALQKSFFDQIYGEVDAQCHSTTNPTVTPKAAIDEVVAARGSKASVDARLDVVLNEDGTLKTQASLVTAAQVQSALGSRNVAVNGDLADWTLGGALAPDSFTLSGAAATIARTGPAMVDTFTFGTGGGGFAAKVTRAGTDWKLTQDIIAAADFAKFVNVKSQKISVAVKGKTAIGSLLRIVIDDGVSTDASSYHTGGGTEEHLSVTHTISNSATKVSVYVEGTGSNGDAYVGGFIFVFSDLAPSDWSPLSIIGDANLTSKGLITTGAQSIAGVKTFASPPIGIDGYARKTADFTKNNSTVFGDVTDLAFAIEASSEYDFEFVMKFVSAAAAGIKFQLTGPAAPTGVIYGLNRTPLAGQVGAAVAFSTSIAFGSSAVEEMMTIRGHVRNGANAGTVQLQSAQQVADVSNTVIRAESYVIYRRRV